MDAARLQCLQRLFHRGRGRAEIDRAEPRRLLGAAPDRRRHQFLRGLELPQQPLHVVEEALGPTRAQLFLKGDLKLSRFMDPTGQSYTLDELRVRDAAAFAKAGVE